MHAETKVDESMRCRKVLSISSSVYVSLRTEALRKQIGVDQLAEQLLRAALNAPPRACWPPQGETR